MERGTTVKANGPVGPDDEVVVARGKEGDTVGQAVAFLSLSHGQTSERVEATSEGGGETGGHVLDDDDGGIERAGDVRNDLGEGGGPPVEDPMTRMFRLEPPATATFGSTGAVNTAVRRPGRAEAARSMAVESWSAMLARSVLSPEGALVRHIAMDIANSLVEPWQRVAELSPDITEIALGSQVLHAIPPSEFVLTGWYEVRFAEQTGGVSYCFPLTILEQVIPKLTGQSLFESRATRGSTRVNHISEGQLLPMGVDVRAVLGEATVPAIDLAMLEPGHIIVLDREVREPLRVEVGNCERFAGYAGTRGRRFAISLSASVDDQGWVVPFMNEPKETWHEDP